MTWLTLTMCWRIGILRLWILVVGEWSPALLMVMFLLCELLDLIVICNFCSSIMSEEFWWKILRRWFKIILYLYASSSLLEGYLARACQEPYLRGSVTSLTCNKCKFTESGLFLNCVLLTRSSSLCLFFFFFETTSFNFYRNYSTDLYNW